MPRLLEPPSNNQVTIECQHRLAAPPAHKAPTDVPASQGSHLRRLPMMYHTGVAQQSWATHHSPLQVKSSHAVDAASAISQRCPVPH